MNYIQKARQKLASKTDVPEELLNLYTLLVFVKGANCTLEDVHDAWSIWQNKTFPKHKSLIPFKELSAKVKEYDREYAEAIQEVAEALKNKLK